MTFDPFVNRLRKRSKHLAKFAQKWPTNAYRVYDRDIPEFPFLIDRYNDAAYVQEFLFRKKRKSDDVSEIVKIVSDVLEIDSSRIVYGVRKKGDGAARYAKGFDRVLKTEVEECGLRFEIRIGEHVDAGLFCDHRILRKNLADLSTETTRALNLFAYTGSFSVHLAGAGATVTTVDLSNTYLKWAQRNFRRNALPVDKHRFERSDVVRFLSQELTSDSRYDIIVMDPPSYSMSKKMTGDFDVQRDYAPLIVQALRLLTDTGTLYFSNNLRTFEFQQKKFAPFVCEEISDQTRSEDFPNNSHRAWTIHRDRDDA